MADVVILLGGDVNTVSASGYFYMDATVSVSPSFSANVSSSPVMRDGERSDNVSVRNTTLSVEGVISNHFLPAEARYNSPSEQEDLIGFNSNRVTSAIGLLRTYLTTKKFITLVLEHMVLENCILKNLDFDLTAQTSEALHARLSFEQLRVATAEKILTYDVIPSKKAEATDTKGGSVGKSLTGGSDGSLADNAAVRKAAELAKKATTKAGNFFLGGG